MAVPLNRFSHRWPSEVARSLDGEGVIAGGLGLAPNLDVIGLAGFDLHGEVEVGAGSGQCGAKTIVSHFGGESGEGGDEGLGAVLNLNGDGAALGAAEGVIIGIFAVHDIGFDGLIEGNFGGGENVVV